MSFGSFLFCLDVNILMLSSEISCPFWKFPKFLYFVSLMFQGCLPSGTWEWVQPAKTASEFDNLSSVPRTHVVERENNNTFLKRVSFWGNIFVITAWKSWVSAFVILALALVTSSSIPCELCLVPCMPNKSELHSDGQMIVLCGSQFPFDCTSE